MLRVSSRRAPASFPSEPALPVAARRPGRRAVGGARRSLGTFGVLALFGITNFPAVPTASAALVVSENRRYLEDEVTGEPFFLTGDAAWSLIAQLPLEEAEAYLDDRAAKGFNLLMVNLIEHAFCSHAPANYYWDPPFTGRPFATPNEAYFAHADAVMAAAEERGIVVLLAPIYLGWLCGAQGWCEEVDDATLAEMRDWGRYVGARYGGFDNLLWLIGGDTDPTPVADKLREVVLGIREEDPVHLLTAHNQPETQAIDPWPGESWIGVNSVYTYSSTLYQACRDAYQVEPVQPYFLLEAAYENEHSSTPPSLRAQSYWAALSGAFGHIFGNCPIWHFGYSPDWCGLTEWQGELDGPGSVSMQHYRRLFESRRWTELVPDLGGTVLTTGAGAYGTTGFATAAYAADGSSLIAYLPSPRTVTVDPAALGGEEIRAWWYDPSDGTATEIGVFPRETLELTPPGGGDRVLVLDDASLGFPPPGEPLPPADLPEASPGEGPSLTLRVWPNPSEGVASIELRRVRPGATRVEILTPDGRLVRELAVATGPSTLCRVLWDGSDARGRPVPSGAYLVRAVTEEGASARKLIRRR